jgi:hypothetical protein
MSVRATITLLALPLFLLLAGVNGVLLYRQEISGIEAGLREQALAAAVTVAEFARESPDPAAMLAEPARLTALRAATGKIPGLAGLHLERPGKPVLRLVDGPFAGRPGSGMTAHPQILGPWRDRHHRLLITAVAPAGRNAAVVAHIDAQPLLSHAASLQRLSIGLIGGSAALALLLGMLVARRVAGELRRTRAVLAGHGHSADEEGFRIREVGELADAIRLIDLAAAAEVERLGRDDHPDRSVGIAALRARHFPPISTTIGGRTFSIRSLRGAPAGCFHILVADEQGYALALGEVGGEPPQALAAAVALRDFVGTGPRHGFAERLSLAADAYGVTRLVTAETGATGALALDDEAGAAAAYASCHPDLEADAVARDLALLMPQAAAIAVIREG